MFSLYATETETTPSRESPDMLYLGGRGKARKMRDGRKKGGSVGWKERERKPRRDGRECVERGTTRCAMQSDTAGVVRHDGDDSIERWRFGKGGSCASKNKAMQASTHHDGLPWVRSPPCRNTTTGNRGDEGWSEESDGSEGVQTLSVRQSSAPVKGCGPPNCKHACENFAASSTPVHGVVFGVGGCHLLLPVGGSAYGMPFAL
jgi:hypothetical protein